MRKARPALHRRFRKATLLAGLGGWAALLAGGAWLNLPAYCASGAQAIAPGWNGLALALILNPPGGLALAWATMIAAMMIPLLDRPLAHIWKRSLARRRLRAAGLFLLGYGAVWMAAGAVLVSLIMVLRAFVTPPGGALLVAGLAALAWQISPARQACLNRCHARARLAPFGLAADRDALAYGLSHGLWCAGACWALMALPLAAERGHIGVMALVAVFLFAERQESPRTPAWRLSWPRSFLPIGRALVRRTMPARAG